MGSCERQLFGHNCHTGPRTCFCKRIGSVSYSRWIQHIPLAAVDEIIRRFNKRNIIIRKHFLDFCAVTATYWRELAVNWVLFNIIWYGALNPILNSVLVFKKIVKGSSCIHHRSDPQIQMFNYWLSDVLITFLTETLGMLKHNRRERSLKRNDLLSFLRKEGILGSSKVCILLTQKTTMYCNLSLK